MGTKKAVKTLQEQIKKLEQDRSESWILQTRSYIKDFFGENSEEFKVAKNLTFSIVVTGMSEEERVRERKYRTAEIRNFLTTSIETLKTKGIKKEPFFKTISETAFWTIFGLLIPSLIGIGFFFGELKSDKQNIELQLELKTTKDSLFIFRQNYTMPPITKNHTIDTAQNTIRPKK